MPIIFYTCYICAIEVPAAFASEHVASIKHRANVRIANEAAQRTRALISALPPPSNEKLNARFCAHCSTIVSKNHDKTKKHRIAVLQDKMLKELMAVYVGDNDDDINSVDILDNINEDLTILGGSQENTKYTEGHDHDELKINTSRDRETCKKLDVVTEVKEVEINDQVINIVKDKITDIDIGNKEHVESVRKESSHENKENTKGHDKLEINNSGDGETCKKLGEITQLDVVEIDNDEVMKIVKNEIIGIEIGNNDNAENMPNGNSNENNENPKGHDGLEINNSEDGETCEKLDDITQLNVVEIDDYEIINEITGIQIVNNINIEKTNENNEDTEGHDGLEINNSRDDETCEKIDEITQLNVLEIDDDEVMNIVKNKITAIEIVNNENIENTRKGSSHDKNEDGHDGLEVNNHKAADKCQKLDEITQLKVAEINDQVINIIKNKITAIETETNEHVENTNRLRYSIDTCNKIRKNMDRSISDTKVRASVDRTTKVNSQYDDFVPHSNKFVKIASDHYHTFVGDGGKMRCVVCNDRFLCEEPLSRTFSLRHLLPKNMRMFDEQDVEKINDIYSHCHICNSVIKNDKLDEHIVTPHHQMNKVKKVASGSNQMPNTNVNEEHVVSSQTTYVKGQATNTKEKVKNNEEQDLETINNIYSYCNICNQLIKNEKLIDHIVTSHHRINIVKKKVASDNSCNQIANTNVNEKHVMCSQNTQGQATKEKVKMIDEQDVKTVSNNFKDEILDIDTSAEDSLTVVWHKVSHIKDLVINDIYSYCNICNQVIKNDNLYYHIQTSHHQMRKVKKAASGNSFNLIANAKENEEGDIDAKVETASHTHNEMGQETNTKEKVKNIDKFRKLIDDVFLEEKVCNTAGSSKVENTKEEVNNTAENIKNTDLWKILEEHFKPIEKANNTAGSTNILDKDKAENKRKRTRTRPNKKKQAVIPTVGYPFKITNGDKVVHCVIRDVPNNPGTTKAHPTGKNTKTADIMKLMNPYEIVQQGKTVRCTICDCFVPNTQKNRQEHLRGPTHAAKVGKKK